MIFVISPTTYRVVDDRIQWMIGSVQSLASAGYLQLGFSGVNSVTFMMADRDDGFENLCALFHDCCWQLDWSLWI
jgi:hypothetical protein